MNKHFKAFLIGTSIILTCVLIAINLPNAFLWFSGACVFGGLAFVIGSEFV